MSHKDAPPETESQKACREWWEKARPTVKRAWGRAQDGSFLAEETRLIHQAWEAASQQANAEVERLRELCGMAYQLAGVHDAPEKWLDALSNAASGRPFSTDGLLPYMPQAVCNAETRALELEREIEALRAEVERLKSMTAVTMGVGPGDGNLFVHGDYESIKAAQAIVLERDALRAEVERLRADLMESDEIREKLGHLLTRTAAALKGEPPEGVWHSWHDLPEKAAQLAEALRELVEVFSESGMYDEELFDKARAALAQEQENNA